MERDSELSQLSRELQQTALTMQKIMGDLQGALREQQHIQGDMGTIQQQIQEMDKLLRADTMRLVLVEKRQTDLDKRLDDFRETQKMGRDWWLKVLGNLTVTAILAAGGLLLSLYLMSKGVKQ